MGILQHVGFQNVDSYMMFTCDAIDNVCRSVLSWKRKNQSMLEIWNRVIT